MEIVERSDVGRVRSTNEDTVASDLGRGCAVLADGMGGLAAGEMASAAAVEVIIDCVRATDASGEALLRSAISEANDRVLALTAAAASGAMGTTVVVWLDGGFGQCFVAHVGDSRAYRLRGGSLEALTEDHSVVQQLVNEGVLSALEARVAPNRNVITRAIGLDSTVVADVRSFVHGPGDVFVLCSDGLSDMLTEQEMAIAVAAHLDPGGVGDLDATADALIAAANRAGGVDNISVTLIRPNG